MYRILNGQEASAYIAQSISDCVYAYGNKPQKQLTQTNIWNQTIKIINYKSMQDPLSHVVQAISEGKIATVFLPSTSLLSAIPYLYKFAADNSSIVLHIAAGSDSSFADFTHVMSVRQSGVAMLCSSTVQESHDFALIAQLISLFTSRPVIHFFDSKRISCEYRSIELLKVDILQGFLTRETVDSYLEKRNVTASSYQSAYLHYKALEVSKVLEKLDFQKEFVSILDQFGKLTGRHYDAVEYYGDSDAEYVIVAIGAGATMIKHTSEAIKKLYSDRKIGMLKISLYRPWSDKLFLSAIPSTVKRIAVLEPTDDNTFAWQPLFLDVTSAYQTVGNNSVNIFSGRYGAYDTDLSPSMVLAVYNNLASNNLDTTFEVSQLTTYGHHIDVGSSSDTEQLIFIENSVAVLQFAQNSQKKNVQVYTLVEKPCVIHVRLSSSSESLLPSLIEYADAVVIGTSIWDVHSEQAVNEAIRKLIPGGYIIVAASDLESSFSSGIKRAIYDSQSKLVSTKASLGAFGSVSNILNHSDSQLIATPATWSTLIADNFSVLTETNIISKSSSVPPVEIPYIKMLDQAFGKYLNIANASNASSIWSADQMSPNSATPEFGFGRLINRIQERHRFVDAVIDIIRQSTVSTESLRLLGQWLLLVNSPQSSSQQVNEVADLVASSLDDYPSLLSRKELLYNTSNWLIGSESWASDLGQSGLHHAITSGQNINILIVDTSPYSNQIAEERKKDVGLYAMNYGSVYTASVALYYSYTGALHALMEADAYKGPSIVLAYLPQVTDAPDKALATLKETKVCVDNGSWPLYRWNPDLEREGQEMFTLDSQRIKEELEAFLARENYLTQLVTNHTDISNILTSSLEKDSKQRHIELKSNARADYARLLSGLNASSASRPPLTVLFGSDNGNGEGIAKKIATRAKIRGHQVKLMAMDDYGDIQDLENESNVVIICSSAGQGEMPSNARQFWKSLNALVKGDINLPEVNVAVFGLGDSHYWPRKEDAVFYNRPCRLLDAKFEALGAVKLIPLGLADDQDEDGFETGLAAWLPELWKSLGIKDSGYEQEPVYTDEQMKIDSNYLRGNLAQDLVDDSTGSLSETSQKLIKFHGAYLQDDRDIREERKKQGLEKAFGFMVRVRTPGGVCTSKQWIAIDKLADKFGNKTLKLTTRQAFQLHGVLKKNLRSTIRTINKSLFTTLGACGDVNRNIISTVITEIPQIHDQVQSLVKELSNLLAPQTSAYYEIWLDNSMVAGQTVQDFEPIYGPSYLPRKFKIAIAVPPNNDADVYAHDLGFIVIVGNEQVIGYNVVIGGGMGQTHGNKKTYPRAASLVGYIPASVAAEVAKAAILTQRDYGDRINRKHARFKYTVDDLGIDFIKNQIEERSGVRFEDAKPFHFDDNLDRYDWTKSLNNTWSFGMFIENGRVKDTPDFPCKTGLRELARFHKGEFRLTANQHLVICNIPEADLEKTKAHLAKYRMDNLSYTGIRKAAMACAALPTCGLAMAESERYLPDLITKFEDTIEEAGLHDDSIVIRMTGCPNGCSRPYLAELAFIGKAPGTYNMYLGGSPKGERLNKLYKENLEEEAILNEVKPMIKRYALERNDYECFGDWVIRMGYVKRTITGKDFHDL